VGATPGLPGAVPEGITSLLEAFWRKRETSGSRAWPKLVTQGEPRRLFHPGAWSATASLTRFHFVFSSDFMSHSMVSNARLALSFLRLHKSWLEAVVGPLKRDPCDLNYDIVAQATSGSYTGRGLSAGAAYAGKESLSFVCTAASSSRDPCRLGGWQPSWPA
jgi:hypothetical protein